MSGVQAGVGAPAHLLRCRQAGEHALPGHEKRLSLGVEDILPEEAGDLLDDLRLADIRVRDAEHDGQPGNLEAEAEEIFAVM